MAQELVQYLSQWMGAGKHWYSDLPLAQDTPEGMEMRKKIAELGEECDWKGMGIAPKYRKVLRALKKVRGARHDLYDGAGTDLTLLEWVPHWQWASKGTAPGLSGVTHDMMSAVTYVGQKHIETEEDAHARFGLTSRLLWQVVNMALQLRRVPSMWKKRAIRVVPKVACSSALKDSADYTPGRPMQMPVPYINQESV